MNLASRSHRLSRCLAPGLILLALAACGGGSGGGSSSSSSSSGGSSSSGSSGGGSGVLAGTVMSGSQPVAGSTVAAFTAGAAGGSATPIGQASTDHSGKFNISGFSPAPAAGQIVYLVAQGGDAGAGGNSATRMISVAGPYCAVAGCGFPSTMTIDELSTVASAYSLAKFIDLAGGGVKLSGASPGIANAAANVNHLVDVTSGQAAAFLDSAGCAGASAPPNCASLEKLDTLANLATACVSSSGPGTSACTGLFRQAGSANDTLSALFAIASTPAARNNAAGLYALAPATPVYTPALNRAPNDWTLALNFKGGGLNQPAEVAVDDGGNVWVTDSVLSGGLSKFSSGGTALSPAAGYTGNGLSGPVGLAIDTAGSVWVADWAQGSGTRISKFNNDGSAVAGSPYDGGGIEGPVDLAFDPAGDLWVANFGNSTLTWLGADGVARGSFQGNGLNFPVGVAVDNAGRVFVANQSGKSVSAFGPEGAPLGVYTGGGLGQPDSMALDPAGDPWVANFAGPSLSELIGGGTPPAKCPMPPGANDSGCPVSPASGYTGGGLSGPAGIAIDSAGQAWVCNLTGNSISQFAAGGTALSGANGYTGPGLLQPYGLAVDASGNLWVANYGGNSLTEFLGIAAPVTTPRMGPPRAAGSS